MQAYEIMIRQVHKVKEGDTVRTVIEKFIDHQISGLPVVNDRNEIVAYISDGDIMRYIGKHQDRIITSVYFSYLFKGDDEEFDQRLQSILKLNVMAIAKKQVIKAQWSDELETIAAVLGEKHIKKLPVERNGVLVGIISRGDVIRHSFKSVL
ncbi:CBS domain-containing protein [Paenibacillus sp. MBLB2552]|uniref:CBS domain-containing protein n=1 Tax=Paenibacillus mellifer TaxID=2937794 RepID=A0A9X2BSQ9_9BACL|nr:CBS domain-containing protein [Paenibacillus mellifer]MCK8487041.1 CBS domain-containing protein [Paenibacillus mellifer]